MMSSKISQPGKDCYQRSTLLDYVVIHVLIWPGNCSKTIHEMYWGPWGAVGQIVVMQYWGKPMKQISFFSNFAELHWCMKNYINVCSKNCRKWANVASIEGSQWSVANEDFLGSIDLIFAPTCVRDGKIYKSQVKVSIIFSMFVLYKLQAFLSGLLKPCQHLFIKREQDLNTIHMIWRCFHLAVSSLQVDFFFEKCQFLIDGQEYWPLWRLRALERCLKSGLLATCLSRGWPSQWRGGEGNFTFRSTSSVSLGWDAVHCAVAFAMRW